MSHRLLARRSCEPLKSFCAGRERLSRGTQEESGGVSSGQRGSSSGLHASKAYLTLVEMTVILSVIAVLTAVLVPTVMSHITQARIVRAKQDVRTLAEAMARFYQDTGFVPQTTDSVDGGPGTNAIDLLVTPGAAPALLYTGAGYGEWVNGVKDYFTNHIVNNVPGYALKVNADSLGWNGPYLANPPQADPWGNRYMLNVRFLDFRAGAVGEDGLVKLAVFVISAGANGVIETEFKQYVTDTAIAGDDIAHRLQ